MFSDQNKLEIVTILEKHFPLLTSTSIVNIKIIPMGAEAQIYSFDLVLNNQTTTFLLKLFRNRLPKDRAENEYLNLCNLYPSSIRVPKPFGFLDNNNSFHRPFMIMEFIDGQLFSKLLYSNITLKNPFLTLFIDHLIHIHNFNWKKHLPKLFQPDISSDPLIIIKSMINRTNRYVIGYNINEFIPLIVWLKTNKLIYNCNQLVFCHGDYHPNNIILTNQNELITLDWSNVSLADRRIDIAFIITVLNSESNTKIDNLVISYYEQNSHVKIEGIEYFKVLVNLFNFLRIFSAASDYSITQESDETRNAFLHEYRNYCSQILSIMKESTKCSFPVIEKFLQ